MRYEIKTLELGGILDQGVSLLRNHFKVLMGIACCFYVPLLLIQAFLQDAMMPDVEALGPQEYAAALAQAMPVLVAINALTGLVFVLLVLPITNAAAIRAVADEYLGEPSSIGKSLSHATSVLLALIVTNIIAWVLVAIGLVLFVIPGIYLALRFWFINYIVVLEGVSGPEALKRSGELMRDNMGTAFVLGILLAIIGFFIGVIVAFVPVNALQNIVGALVQAALLAFQAAVAVVFYFSARCKYEHFDLALLAEAVGKEAPSGGGESGPTAGAV